MGNRFLRVLVKGDLSTVVNLSSTFSDGFRHNRRAGMWSIVNHLSTRVLVLPCISKGDREHGTTRSFSIKVNRWIFHSRFGTQVSINPLNSGILLSLSTLCYQVIDVIRPVLDSCITHISSVQSKNFYNGSVQAIA
ncbi:Uncharacterised protein [Streptococcus pneumoniae]|nr:Uncharacterised protein [Streptococcus pneumoniae]